MKESAFIEENKEDWQNLEDLLESQKADPRTLHNLFIKVSGDLSYARTFYPNRRVRLYLNGLINELFDKMRIRKKIKIKETITHYYTHVLPTEIIRNRNAFLLSALVFIISIAIGAYSTFVDQEFLRLILGDDYVNMTLENINNGDPMAVYKFGNESYDFLRITVNNIQVAFLAFGLGFFFGLGTVYVLIHNGVMVGAFQSFFALKGLFLTSFLTIWIHGTLEISSIVIAGASGLILGRSLIFPGTFTRKASLAKGAISALVIMLSTVPIFVVAAFLEGFVTRQTGLPTGVKILILLVSAFVILSLYVIYPWIYYKRGHYQKTHSLPFDEKKEKRSGQGQTLLEYVANKYSDKIELLLHHVVLPLLSIIAIVFFIYFKLKEMNVGSSEYYYFNIRDILLSPMGLSGFLILSSYMIAQSSAILNMDQVNRYSGVQVLKRQPLSLILVSGLLLVSLLFYSSFFTVLAFLFLPVMGLFRIIDRSHHTKHSSNLIDEIKEGSGLFGAVIGVKIMVVLMVFIIMLFLNSFIDWWVLDFFNWHPIFQHAGHQKAFWSILVYGFVILLIYPYLHLLLSAKLERKHEELDCVDLYESLEKFKENHKE